MAHVTDYPPEAFIEAYRATGIRPVRNETFVMFDGVPCGCPMHAIAVRRTACNPEAAKTVAEAGLLLDIKDYESMCFAIGFDRQDSFPPPNAGPLDVAAWRHGLAVAKALSAAEIDVLDAEDIDDDDVA